MRHIRLWAPAVVWMGLIFFLSGRHSIEVSPDQILNFLFFKTLHVGEYAVLYFLFWRALRATTRRAFIWAFVLTILYAISDEIHQTVVPTREGRARDVIIDAIGATLTWIITAKLLPRMPGKLQKLVKR